MVDYEDYEIHLDNLSGLKAGRYRHYKGNEYQVFGLVRHSETEEELVLYQPLYGELETRDLWVRPLRMFVEFVQVGGIAVPRFKFVATIKD